MKNKSIIIIISVILLLAILFFIFKFVLLPKIQHENTLKDPTILCLTLDVAHGCSNENYNEEELEKYLKSEVLKMISLKDAEEIVSEKIQAVTKERAKENYDSESPTVKKELENQKKYCEEYKNESEIRAKKEGHEIRDFSCRGSSGLDYLVYLDKVLLVIQKIKHEQQ